MQWIYFVLILFCVVCVKPYTTSAECDATQFACTDGKCINMAWKCDDDDDCKDGSDENECPSTTCSDGFFRCDSGKCIPERWVCDETPECPDSSDEKPELCKNQTCIGYRCKNSSQCILTEWKCDGQADCPMEDDETGCNNTCDSLIEFECKDKRCISFRWKCDHHADCDDGSDEVDCPKTDCDRAGERMCHDGECISEVWFCDGDTDCKDHSDELNCTEKFTDQTCGPTEFQCHDTLADPQCINNAWKCDGDDDCPDGSDEINCSDHICSTEEAMCDNHSCVKKDFFCDGELDCDDGTDEENCTDPVVHVRHCMDNEFDCGIHCISNQNICDGVDDCGNGADELFGSGCPFNENNTCTVNNGGCSHICIPSHTSKEFGSKCECRAGFTFTSGSSTECVDVDECEVSGICSQKCINTKGSYKCECDAGYTLINHRHCKASDGSHAELIISDRHELRRYQLDTYHYSLLLYKQVSGAVAMDFDIRNKIIYWSDVQTEKICSANLTTGEIKVIVEDNIYRPDGLAVDWTNGNLYLSDTGPDTIQVARLDGSSRTTLVDKDLEEPRALVVDPSSGWMYWTDWGHKPKIEKCGMNGQYRSAIVTKHIEWPNGLTIDYALQRLFWVDAKLHTIGSSDLNGNNFKYVLKNNRNLGHPFAITVFEDYIYWTDWVSNSVHRINKFGHGNITTIAMDLKTPMDIHVYHIYRQPIEASQCGKNNGGCSHLCLPVPEINTSSLVTKQKVCVCPDSMILDGTYNCKPSDRTLPTKKPSNSSTDTGPNRPQTYKPTDLSVSTKPVINVEQITQDTFFNATHIFVKKESVGFVAGIVIIILVISGFLTFVAIFMLLKRHKSRNLKSMNFDNPVYRKTTTDDHLILHKHGSRSDLHQSTQPLNPDNEIV